MQNILGVIIYSACTLLGVALGISLIVKGGNTVPIVIGCVFVALSSFMAFAVYEELKERGQK